MERGIILGWLACASLLVATDLLAQTGQPLTLAPVDPPRWDAGGGVGLLYLHQPAERAYSGWDVHGEIRFDLGYYWTNHLKTEVGVSLPQAWWRYQNDVLTVPGSSVPVYTFSERRERLTSLTPGLTYQFFENSFAHPYVSAGLRVGILESRVERFGYSGPRGGATPPVTIPVDPATTSVEIHPFLAAGFKSYFNSRTYVRSEALTVPAPAGKQQLSFRLSFGVDF
jgi:hypothetical protein